MNFRTAFSWVGAVTLFGFAAGPLAADWPQWRYDEYRSADSPEQLPANLKLEWVREYSPRVQVWDDPLNHDLMTFDRVFEPVVLGNRMFLAFNDTDKVVALDTQTGRELWSFYTEGPVRLPPVCDEGRVYITSDDGYLYCLDAEKGAALWKFRGAPGVRKVLGNGRVISAWPARGGPVLRDGRVYFAASIWPFMGTFIYALDARSGAVVWVNDGTGAQYINQPHSAAAFAGVAPQGPLVATKDFLLVPGGRSVPAAFNRHTGEFLHFQIDAGGKGNGGSFVAANDTEFYVHTRLRGTRSFDLKTGKKGTFTPNEPVITPDWIYSAQEHSYLKTAVVDAKEKYTTAQQTEADAKAEVVRTQEEGVNSAYKKATNSLASAKKKTDRALEALHKAENTLSNNWAGNVIQAVNKEKVLKWEIPADGSGDLIKAGSMLYAAGTNAIIALQLSTSTNPPTLAWSNPVTSRIQRLLTANGKLFAVTLEGRIMAFGAGQRRTVTLADRPTQLKPARTALAKAKEILEAEETREGYALWLGLEDEQLFQAVLQQSKLHITAVDPDPERVKRLRRQLDAAGLYGKRVSLMVRNPFTCQFPPYIANLVVVDASMASRLGQPEIAANVFQSVRPYGGRLWVALGAGKDGWLRDQMEEAALPNAKFTAAADHLLITREGALPGSDDWTHQYGDIGNTVKSDDQLVRLPLGLLWFGGNTHMDVLPRHGHGPSEQIAGGRLFIEGMSSLSARDVYTGRVLWKTEFGDLGNYGVYYDSSYTNLPLTTAYNQKHIPGANARGANYVVTTDSVYLVQGQACHVLDTRTGKTVSTIQLPKWPGETEPPEWGYIGVYEDLLLAGAGFAHFTTRLNLGTNKSPAILDLSASRGLAVLNRQTGQVLWQAKARHGFIHNGIVAGNGRVYCLDKLPKTFESRLRRRGRTAPTDYRIAAFDVRTGRPLWEANTNIFGTWLGYSKQHDVLLQAGASATDRLKDEAEKGMLAYRGRDGAELWKNLDVKYTGPCIIHKETILTTPGSYKTNSGAFALLDGKPRLLVNPITRQPESWKIYRTYGCNYPVACENLLTFRSGAAGFYDLETHGGTGNFGGFKSGCSPNLIAADGVLNSPDYTRTCSCPYQNQTSLAFVHMPELEIWMHNLWGSGAKPGQRVERVGINFGAPGDRRSSTGTLWLEYPSVGGNSPQVPITVQGARTNYFRRHATQMTGQGPAWVVASGVRGANTIRIAPETRRPTPPPSAPKKSEDDDDDDEDDDKTSTTSKSGDKKEATTSSATNKTATVTAAAETIYKSQLPPAPYTVRLYFAEPENLKPGQRVFDVSVQDRPVLRNFDVVAEAGGPWRGVLKEFRSVVVGEELVISLRNAKAGSHEPILCGVEMILEETLAGDTTLPAGN